MKPVTGPSEMPWLTAAPQFAKLEIAVSTVTFFAHYDFKRCDKHGNEPKDDFPTVDRSGIGEKRPVRDIFLRCTRRT